MTTYVRARDTHTDATITLLDVALDKARHTLVDEPALDPNGDPMPPSYPASVDAPADNPANPTPDTTRAASARKTKEN